MVCAAALGQRDLFIILMKHKTQVPPYFCVDSVYLSPLKTPLSLCSETAGTHLAVMYNIDWCMIAEGSSTVM